MKFAPETCILQKKAIKKIDIMSKSGDAYMKGLVITYVDDESDIINSGDGYLVQTIEFGPLDELVGITVDETSESDKRPRKIGFTIMKKVWTAFNLSNKERRQGPLEKWQEHNARPEDHI